MMIKIEKIIQMKLNLLMIVLFNCVKMYMNIVLNEADILPIYGNKKSTDYRRIFIHDYSSKRMGRINRVEEK